MITINGFFHGAEFVRLQRMRLQKPQEVMLLQNFLHDNSLRSKMQRLICLRRLKHASLIGRYYWIRGRYQSAGLDFNLHDVGIAEDNQFATYSGLEDGKKHFHHMRNNLDISDVGVGLGLDLECFSSFLAASIQMDSKRRFILRNNKSGKCPRLKKSDLRKLTDILDGESDHEQLPEGILHGEEIESEDPCEEETIREVEEILKSSNIEENFAETVLNAVEEFYDMHDLSSIQDPGEILLMEEIVGQNADAAVEQTFLFDMQLVQDLQMMEELQALQELRLMHELQISQQQETVEEQAVVDSLMEIQLAELDPLFAEELASTANYLAQLKRNRRRRARAQNIASTMPKSLTAPIKRKNMKAVRIVRKIIA